MPNQAMFIVSPQMTKFDVEQYLQKIYKIPVVHVNLFNRMGRCRIVLNMPILSNIFSSYVAGKTKTTPNTYVTKEVDDKVAIVFMVCWLDNPQTVFSLWKLLCLVFLALQTADQKFTFPPIFGKDDAEEKAKDSVDEMKSVYKKKTQINTSKQGIPSWFSHWISFLFLVYPIQ